MAVPCFFETPKCIVFIPDACRRCYGGGIAGALIGHAQGRDTVRAITDAAYDMGVKHVVVWAASEGNLRREPEEVEHLYQLFEAELEYRRTKEDRARFYVRGRWAELAPDQSIVPRLKDLVREAEERTQTITDLHFTILFGYDGEMEIAAAVQELMRRGISHLFHSVDEIAELQRKVSWTSHLPSIDLFIRTGLESGPRESELLLPFKRKNAECYDTAVFWPNFTAHHLREAIADFHGRPRRRGN